MYDFANKTQSVWFFAYMSALFLAILSFLSLFNVLTLTSSLPLDKTLLYSGLLFSIGAGFGLGSLESSERNLFWKWKLFWLLLVLVGLVLTLSGVFSSYTNNQIFNANASTLFAIGVVFLVYGTIFFFSGMSEETRESFGKLGIVFLVLLILGFVAGVGGFAIFFLTTGGRDSSLYPVTWQFLTYLAIVLGTLSIIPFAYIMGSRDSEREKFHKFWIIWAILALAGLVLFALTVVEVLTNQDVIGGAAHRQAGLILSLVFQAPGFVFLISSTDKEDLIKKLDFLWVVMLVTGVVLAFASQLVSSLPLSTIGIGLALTIMSSGMLYKSISTDYSPTTVSKSAGVSRSTGSVVSSAKSGFDVPNDLPVEEKKFYIEMQRKTNENTIVSLNNAAKGNRLSKDFVGRKVQELTTVNAQSESIIEGIMEQAKRSSRQSIFEQAMGTETPQQSKSAPSPSSPMSPPGPPSSPPPAMSPPAPKPQSSGPPMPPPTPSGPPMPPAGGAPKPPSPPSGAPKPPSPPSGTPPMPPTGGAPKPPSPPGGVPPMPPGMGGAPKPPGMPPMPPGAAPPMPPTGGAPKAPGAPGGDAVGTARSTSIAELRGEMLKELRRLRDIFNEDQK